jgi:hypothetical protein
MNRLASRMPREPGRRLAPISATDAASKKAATPALSRDSGICGSDGGVADANLSERIERGRPGRSGCGFSVLDRRRDLADPRPSTQVAPDESGERALDNEITRRRHLCDEAENAEWEDRISAAANLSAAEKLFLKEHPPGLVRALWDHFEATRDVCSCETPAHERPDCPTGLIERLLLDQESQ